MRLNLTCVWKVMTIWVSRELRFSISSVSICDAPESDIWVKSYDNLNFSRSSGVQFRASRYMMRLNRTSERKVTNIWITRELTLFNVERLDILCSWIGISCEKLWPFEISRELPLFNFEHLDILCPRFGHLCEKQWLFEFLESFRCSISIVPIYYVPESDIRAKIHDHLNFSTAFVVQFRVSQ